MVLTSPTMSRRHVSWADCYLKASEELRGPAALCGRGYDAFDRLVESCIDDDTKFVAKANDHPNFNFVLLPTQNKGVLNVAHCMSTWHSKLQTTVSLSTTEAEYVALSTAMRDVIYFINLIQEIQDFGIKLPHASKPKVSCRVFEDNVGALECYL